MYSLHNKSQSIGSEQFFMMREIIVTVSTALSIYLLKQSKIDCEGNKKCLI